MKVVIEFDVKNAAFDDWQREVKRVVGAAATRLADLPDRPAGALRAPLFDSNGNTVGSIRVEEE